MNVTMTDTQDEKHLVQRAQEGNTDAFGELFRLFRDHLLATIRTRTGEALATAVDPEDILQDTYVRALGSISRFEWRGEGSTVRWLQGIASHLLLDAARRRARNKQLQIDRDPESDDPSASRDGRRKERFERLERAFQDLKPEYRKVLRLARIEGLQIGEIAARTGKSVSAISNLLLRATKQLKQGFGDTQSLHLGDRRFGEGRCDNA